MNFAKLSVTLETLDCWRPDLREPLRRFTLVPSACTYSNVTEDVCLRVRLASPAAPYSGVTKASVPCCAQELADA